MCPPIGGGTGRVWENFSVDDNPEEYPDPLGVPKKTSVSNSHVQSHVGSKSSSSTGFGGPRGSHADRAALFGYRPASQRASLSRGRSVTHSLSSGSLSRSHSGSGSGNDDENLGSDKLNQSSDSLVHGRRSHIEVFRRSQVFPPVPREMAQHALDGVTIGEAPNSAVVTSAGTAAKPPTGTRPNYNELGSNGGVIRPRREVSFLVPNDRQEHGDSTDKHSFSDDEHDRRANGRRPVFPSSSDSFSDHRLVSPQNGRAAPVEGRSVPSHVRRQNSLPSQWRMPENGSFQSYLFRRHRRNLRKQWTQDLFVVQHNVLLICTRETPFLVKHCIPLVNLQKIEPDEKDDRKFSITYLAPLKKGKSRTEIMQCRGRDAQECHTCVRKLQQLQRKALIRGDPITDFVERATAEETLRSAYAKLHGTSGHVLANVLGKLFDDHENSDIRYCYYRWRSYVQGILVKESQLRAANVDQEVKERTHALEVRLRNQTLEMKGERAFRLAGDRIAHFEHSVLHWALSRLKWHAELFLTKSMAVGAASLITYSWRQAAEIQAADAATWRRRRINGIFMLMRQRRLRDAFEQLRVYSQLWSEIHRQRIRQLGILVLRKHEVGLAECHIILDRWRTYCDLENRRKHAVLVCLRNECYRQSRAVLRKWYLGVARKCVFDLTAVSKMSAVLDRVGQRQLGWCFRVLANYVDEQMNLETLQVAANFNMLNSKLVKSFNQVPLHRGVLALHHALSNIKETRLRAVVTRWQFKTLRQRYCEKAACTMAAMCTAVHRRRAICEALFKWLNHSHRHRRRELAISAGSTKLTVFMRMKKAVDVTSCFSHWRNAAVLDQLRKEKDRIFARYGKVIDHGRMTAMETFCRRLAFWAERVERRHEIWVLNALRTQLASTEVLRRIARLHLLGRVVALFDRLRMAKLASAWQLFRINVRDEDLCARDNADRAIAALQASEYLRREVLQRSLTSGAGDSPRQGCLATIPEEPQSGWSEADHYPRQATGSGSSPISSLPSRLQSDSGSSISFLLGDHSSPERFTDLEKYHQGPLGADTATSRRKRRRTATAYPRRYRSDQLAAGKVPPGMSCRRCRAIRTLHLAKPADAHMRRGHAGARPFKAEKRAPNSKDIRQYRKRMVVKHHKRAIERTTPRAKRVAAAPAPVMVVPQSLSKVPALPPTSRLVTDSSSSGSEFHLHVKAALREAERYLASDVSSRQSSSPPSVQHQDHFGGRSLSSSPGGENSNAAAFVEEEGPMMPGAVTTGVFSNAASQSASSLPRLYSSQLGQGLSSLPSNLLPLLDDDISISVSEIDDIISQLAAAEVMLSPGSTQNPSTLIQTGLPSWCLMPNIGSGQASNHPFRNTGSSIQQKVVAAMDLLSQLIENQKTSAASTSQQAILWKKDISSANPGLSRLRSLQERRVQGNLLGYPLPRDYAQDRSQMSVDDWVDWGLLSAYLKDESAVEAASSDDISSSFPTVSSVASPNRFVDYQDLQTPAAGTTNHNRAHRSADYHAQYQPSRQPGVSESHRGHRRSRRYRQLQELAAQLLNASAEATPAKIPTKGMEFSRSPIAPIGFAPVAVDSAIPSMDKSRTTAQHLPESQHFNSKVPGSQQVAFRTLLSRKHVRAI